MGIMKGSALDIYIIPVLVFVTIIVLLCCYAVINYFFNESGIAPESENATLLFNNFKNIGIQGLGFIDVSSLGIIFTIIIASGLLAFTIKSHPVFFPIFIFVGAIVMYVWGMMYETIENDITSNPIIGPYFSELSWLPVMMENMPALISITTGFILVALYFKPTVIEVT